MANFTGGKGCSADTHLIPPTDIKVAGAEDGNSSSANPKIQPTEAKVGEEKATAMDSTSWLGRFGQLYLALRSLVIRASPLKTEIERGKATGARDGNSSAASPKIHPPHAGSACGKTSWPGRFGPFFYPVLLSLLIRVLPVNKYWLETFWKLSPIRRALIIRAFVAMGFMLILALAVPTLLLVLFHGQEMAQVWVMSLTLCSYALFASLFIWRDWWFYTDFVRLSYGPLLAYFAATAIGPRTAIFILHWSTVWAAGYLGCSIALHRLHKRTELGIDELPRPSCHSKYAPKELTILVCIRALILSVGWTIFMVLTVYGPELTEELHIVLILSSIGWIHVALWLYYVANDLMHGVLLKGPMSSLPYLVPCAVFTPTLMLLPVMLSVLLHWLLLMALVGFLGYHLAVYIRYLHTAAPCETIALEGD